MASDGEELLALMALFIFFIGAGIATVVLNSIALATGLGSVDLATFTSSTTPAKRASFGYGEVCIGAVSATGDDSPSRSQVLNDDSASAVQTTCIPYADATVARLTPLVPVGENVLAAACEQLATADLQPAIAGSILAMVLLLAVGVHVRRACTVCCRGKANAQAMYACTTRTVLLLLVIGLCGALTTVATVSRLAARSDLWLTQTDTAWETFESRASGERTSNMDINVKSDQEGWFGVWQVIPASICVLVGLILEGATYCVVKPEATLFPCCPRSCCGGGSADGTVGCCADELISPDDCDRACHPLYYSKRRTTDDAIDNWVADWMRICALPPIVGVHVAAAVLGTIAATGGVFTLEVTGQLYNGTRTLSRFVEVQYSMTLAQSCLTSQSTFLTPPGSASITDCFDNTQPRRLLLGPPPSGSESVLATDFSVVAMADVAPFAAAAGASALLRAVVGFVPILVLALGLFCSIRRGAAARAFKCWGRIAGVGMLVSAVAGIGLAAAVVGSVSSMGGNSFLAVLRGARIDDDDDYGEDVLAAIAPVAPPLRFDARRLDFKVDLSELIVASMALAIVSAVLLVPLSACIVCGTFNGGDSANAPARPAAAAGGGGTAARARILAAAIAASSAAAEATTAGGGASKSALVARFGCLADVADSGRRERYQRDAEEMAEQIRQIRSAGIAGCAAIESSMKSGKPMKVRRRVDELLSGAAPGSSKPSMPAARKASPAPAPAAPAFPVLVPAAPAYPGADAPPAPASWGGGAAEGFAAAPTPVFPGAAAGYPPVGGQPPYPSAGAAPAPYPSAGAPPSGYGGGGGDTFAL